LSEGKEGREKRKDDENEPERMRMFIGVAHRLELHLCYRSGTSDDGSQGWPEMNEKQRVDEREGVSEERDREGERRVSFERNERRKRQDDTHSQKAGSLAFLASACSLSILTIAASSASSASLVTASRSKPNFLLRPRAGFVQNERRVSSLL